MVPELAAIPAEEGTLLQRQQAFGYTQEDISRFLEPMAVEGDDPVGSMGTDTPIAVLSDRARLLYDYFKQNFAQVTNPPIDPIREELVMSLTSMIGPRPNLLGRDAGHAQAARSRSADPHQRGSRQDPLGGRSARRRVPLRHHRHHLGRFERRRGHRAGDQGNVLGRDRGGAAGSQHPDPLGPRAEPRPARRCRHCWPPRRSTTTSCVRACGCRPASWSRTGEAREVHHFCVLAGYGAEAINPYLAFETLEALREAKRHCRSEPRQGGAAELTSRPSARACSRSCPRWASRPTSPTAAPRSSTRSGCPRASSSIEVLHRHRHHH